MLYCCSCNSNLQSPARITGLRPLQQACAWAILLHLLCLQLLLSICHVWNCAHLLRLPIDHVSSILFVLNDNVHHLFGWLCVQVWFRVVVQLRMKRVAQSDTIRVGCIHAGRGVALESRGLCSSRCCAVHKVIWGEGGLAIWRGLRKNQWLACRRKICST